jgi:hypothetical protein
MMHKSGRHLISLYKLQNNVQNKSDKWCTKSNFFFLLIGCWSKGEKENHNQYHFEFQANTFSSKYHTESMFLQELVKCAYCVQVHIIIKAVTIGDSLCASNYRN